MDRFLLALWNCVVRRRSALPGEDGTGRITRAPRLARQVGWRVTAGAQCTITETRRDKLTETDGRPTTSGGDQHGERAGPMAEREA